jgi:hypothetical protein
VAANISAPSPEIRTAAEPPLSEAAKAEDWACTKPGATWPELDASAMAAASVEGEGVMLRQVQVEEQGVMIRQLRG